MDKYESPDFFNYQYNKYVENYGKAEDETPVFYPVQPSSQMDEYDEPAEPDVAPKQKVEQKTLKVAPKQHVT